jgi:hypothetical protein
MTEATTRAVLSTIEASRDKALFLDVVARAVRYARLRTDCALGSSAERRDMDLIRTAAHDAFIDALNILSREMRAAGEDNSWRATLGNDRRILGDVACYLHLVLGLRAR